MDSKHRQHRSLAQAPRQSGASLIEVVIAVGLMAGITAVMATVLITMNRAHKRNEALTAASQETQLFLTAFKKHWLRRIPPQPVAGVPLPAFTAAWPGFCLPDGSNGCTSEFPQQLRLNVDNLPPPSQFVTATTSCVPATGLLATVNFAAASSCAGCGVGTRPVVTLDATAVGGNVAVYPPNAADALGSVVSMSMCVQPWSWGAPMSVMIETATLDYKMNLVTSHKLVGLPMVTAAGVSVDN